MINIGRRKYQPMYAYKLHEILAIADSIILWCSCIDLLTRLEEERFLNKSKPILLSIINRQQKSGCPH